MKSSVIQKFLKFYSILILLLGFSTTIGQVSGIRTTVSTNNNYINLSGIKNSNTYSAYSNSFSSLHFNGSPATYGEFPKEAIAPAKYQYIVIDPNNKSSKNWTRTLLWESIPKTTKYGRLEISILPFPSEYNPQFSGIIRVEIIRTNGNTSQTFPLVYNDEEVAYTPSSQSNKPKISPVRSNNSTSPTLGTRPSKNGEATMTRGTTFAVNSNLLSKSLVLDLQGNTTRKFYIRIIPFDAADKIVPAITNDIIMEETLTPITEPWKQNTANYAADDYTITGITYVPVHFEEAGFTGCTIVTGYNDNLSLPDNVKSDLKKGFPIGRVICPEPPEDKAWYEKTFNGIAGFVSKSINGAASFYNETKEFVKTTAVNSICSKAPKGTEGGCKMAAGAGFEYGMACVGIPPSLPNIDDLTLMAEGQIVDLACDKIAEESSFPVPDEAREKLRNELHNNLTSSVAKGNVSEGYLNLKPHPRGQFQTAYLKIEVTRTGNSYKGKDLATFSIADKTSGSTKTYNKQTKTNETVLLTGNLFENNGATIPYLENVGDKTTVYVVLKPQESYVHFNSSTNTIKSIGRDIPSDGSQIYPMPTYEGYAHTLGFQLLLKDGFTTQFIFGLKVASGVILNYPNTGN